MEREEAKHCGLEWRVCVGESSDELGSVAGSSYNA